MRTILLLALLAACAPASPRTPAAAPPPQSMASLEGDLREIIRSYAADTAEVSVALTDLATSDSLLINAHTTMHAASTMKVPVMIQLFRRADTGEYSITDSMVVRNEFRSIADGSTYNLSPTDDSDPGLYEKVGERVPVRELIERMIARSSNLATNLLIETADPDRIAATLEEFGAGEMRVLRGVEDIPAYERGMNNTTTAYGLMKTLEAIASGQAASPAATEEMLEILCQQEFREMIPAGLPPGTPVANKTGWITGINHDGAIVLPEGRPPYVLVVLTRGFQDREASAALASEISARVYQALAGMTNENERGAGRYRLPRVNLPAPSHSRTFALTHFRTHALRQSVRPRAPGLVRCSRSAAPRPRRRHGKPGPRRARRA